MARPIKNNCDYFPHRTTMRNHRKIKALRSTFGQVLGYAFWSMFVEYLTEQDGIELENSEMEIEMFAGELGVSAAEIRSMIDYCIKIELLFLTEDNFIYSDSLNTELQPVFEKRNREKEKSMTRKRHENGTFATDNTTSEGVSVAETPQIRVDKSRVDNSISILEEKKPKKPTIEERKIVFKEKLKSFLDTYSRDMLNDFFFYWTEHNPDGQKMRFEMEKVFDVKRRLKTWYKNSLKNNKFTPQSTTPLILDTADIDKARRLEQEYMQSLKI